MSQQFGEEVQCHCGLELDGTSTIDGAEGPLGQVGRPLRVGLGQVCRIHNTHKSMYYA